MSKDLEAIGNHNQDLVVITAVLKSVVAATKAAVVIGQGTGEVADKRV